MVNVNLEFGYLDQNAEITKEDEKKDILHLDILKWYNVFQLCQRFCIKVLYIYCKNAFDDSFMPPSQKWTGVLKCQKLKIVSHTIHGIPFKNTNKTSI